MSEDRSNFGHMRIEDTYKGVADKDVVDKGSNLDGQLKVLRGDSVD